jgi:hypothetical protein
MSVFEKRVLRRISVLQMEELIGGWRECHHEGIHDSFMSLNISKVKSRRFKMNGT